MHQLARTPHRDPGATSASFRLIQSHSLFIFKHSIQRADSIPYPAGEQHCFSCTLQHWHPAWSPSSCHLPALSCHQGPHLAHRKCMSCREKHQADPKHAAISEAWHSNHLPWKKKKKQLRAGLNTAIVPAPGLDPSC